MFQNDENASSHTREQFQRLLNSIPVNDYDLYQRLKHNRVEPVFNGRSLIVYQAIHGHVSELDSLRVHSLRIDATTGVSCEIYSRNTQRTMTVGYSPKRLFDFDVMVWIPLSVRLRWSLDGPNQSGPSAAWDIAIRTRSRFSLREPGVQYCETGASYAKEFINQEA